jgi:hypothetical protein
VPSLPVKDNVEVRVEEGHRTGQLVGTAGLTAGIPI